MARKKKTAQPSYKDDQLVSYHGQLLMTKPQLAALLPLTRIAIPSARRFPRTYVPVQADLGLRAETYRGTRLVVLEKLSRNGDIEISAITPDGKVTRRKPAKTEVWSKLTWVQKRIRDMATSREHARTVKRSRWTRTA